MNDDELRQVERQLRTIFREMELDWVLPSVDASVAEGRVEEAPSYRVDLYAYPWGNERRRGTSQKPSLATRPLVPRERVEYLLDAIERLLFEVPRIHKSSWEILNRGMDGRLPMIDGMVFISEDDSPAGNPPALTATEEGPAATDLASVRELLEQIRHVVQS